MLGPVAGGYGACCWCSLFVFFNDTATTEIYTLSLHDALPIRRAGAAHRAPSPAHCRPPDPRRDRKSTRLNSSHANNSYAVFCLKKKKEEHTTSRRNDCDGPTFAHRGSRVKSGVRTPPRKRCSSYFFFNDTATTEIYTLSLHDALPISDPDTWATNPHATATTTGRRLGRRSEEHTSELQSRQYLVCRLLLEKKKTNANQRYRQKNKKKK